MAYLTIGLQIIQLLKDNLGAGEYNSYFFGDPDLIGKSNLPAIVVEEMEADTTVEYTGMDKETKTIVIKVVLDKRDDWGASDTIDTTFAKIRDLIDGRDPNTGQYLKTSLKGILRTNFTLSDNLQPVAGGPQPYVVDQDLKARYFVNRRPGEGGDLVYTQEGWLTGKFTELIVVPGRT